MYKFKIALLTMFTVIAATACANHNESTVSKDTTPIISDENTTPINSDNKENSIKPAEPDLYAISVDDGIKEFILKDITENWIEDGSGGLTENSKRKLIKQLLPAGKKQFDLGYNAQIAKNAEDISEVNVVKTIIERDGQKKTFKTYLESKADKKIRAALANAETTSVNICRHVGNNCQEKVLGILLTINKSARQKADRMMQQFFEDKYKNEKPDL